MIEKCFYGIKLYGILWNKVYAVNYILKFYFQQFTRMKGFNMKQNCFLCFLLVFHFFKDFLLPGFSSRTFAIHWTAGKGGRLPV